MKIETIKIEMIVTVNPVLPSEREFHCLRLINADEIKEDSVSEVMTHYLAEKMGRDFNRTMAKEGFEV